MKIGFYSSMPLENKANWSGTMYKMYEKMQEMGHDIEWIPQQKLSGKEERTLKKIQNIFYRIFHRGYNTKVNLYTSWRLGKKITPFLKQKDYDLLFVPTYLNDFALVKTNIPIVYLNDANVAQLLNYYPYYSGFGWLSKWETKKIEKMMLKKSSVNIFSSEWAANYAVNHYGINPDKVKVLKFGANLAVPDFLYFNEDKCEDIVFLFLAVDWERKRGDLAYEAVKILRQKGYSVKLQIIGCNPQIQDKWVNIIPYLNKNFPNDLAKIQMHLLHSHFLFVPTKADCTPIAFCEAAGYGLPVISTDTGGVSAHVENGKTGLLLAQNSSSKDYADAIEKIIIDEPLMQKLSLQARKKYENELNWEVWKGKFLEIISKTID
ncbi:glycosyltransferase family 4 protein [Chryseobacterium sp. RLHN22]|uniref:glycosyltransferase family 4 protein n=1 Tax=Chryseobacterium sp. RLHN22 TaxID=3437885 RepID=UPI003D9AD769